MSDKLEQYSDVITRLVSEAVACTPQEWTRGTLTIECDGTRIDYKLKNEDQPGKALISEKLRDLIDELYVRMAHSGDAWTQAVVTFFQEGDDGKFNTSFQYAKTPPASSTSAKKKPWWKFGRA
ncbi:hypothetical protein [Marinobacter mangrovi]|uniref:hypothetical protein n=1 Tax=Marinobacter mangrovi TaxID=2803918 RepID=UPI001932B0D1|nr:hypothetical protein [Marinobacter mangrovi]